MYGPHLRYLTGGLLAPCCRYGQVELEIAKVKARDGRGVIARSRRHRKSAV